MMNLETLKATLVDQEAHRLENVERYKDFLVDNSIYPPYREVESVSTEPEVIVEGRSVLMFCSNNYLGLSTNPEVVQAAAEQLHIHGLGPGGSRILSGNIAILNSIERKIAEFVGTEDSLTFPTGYMANLSVFHGLLDPFLTPLAPYRKGDAVVLCDEYNHATVFDGIALSAAKRVLLRHDDMDDLERKLIKYADASPKMIVTEGVWSLDGRLSPLPQVAELAERHDAILMVDDAHGVGWLGPRGGGTVQHYGLEGRVDVIMGSFDKALGGIGGFLAGKRKIIDYLRISARAYMFSSSMQGLNAGAMIRAMDICMEQPVHRERLHANAKTLVDGLRRMGFTVWGDGTVPVAPLIIGDEMASVAFSNRIFELGVLAPPFRYPAAPMGTARIRVTPMATHSPEHLERALAIFEQAGREMGLLTSPGQPISRRRHKAKLARRLAAQRHVQFHGPDHPHGRCA
jgi:8-amino-7-oxononanoate synthase